MNFSPKLTFFVLRNFFGRKNFDPKLRRRRIGPLKKKLNNNFLFNYQETGLVGFNSPDFSNGGVFFVTHGTECWNGLLAKKKKRKLKEVTKLN